MRKPLYITWYCALAVPLIVISSWSCPADPADNKTDVGLATLALVYCTVDGNSVLDVDADPTRANLIVNGDAGTTGMPTDTAPDTKVPASTLEIASSTTTSLQQSVVTACALRKTSA
jgi:hypothetical protein